MVIAYVLVALVGGGIAAFALQNLDPVVVRFLVWRIEGIPLAMVILLSLVAGMLLVGVAGAVPHVKLRLRVRHLESRIAQLAAAGGRPETDRSSR